MAKTWDAGRDTSSVGAALELGYQNYVGWEGSFDGRGCTWISAPPGQWPAWDLPALFLQELVEMQRPSWPLVMVHPDAVVVAIAGGQSEEIARKIKKYMILMEW